MTAPLFLLVIVAGFFAETLFTLTNLRTQEHRPLWTATFAVLGMIPTITGIYGVLNISLLYSLPLGIGVFAGSFTTVLIRRKQADDAPDQLDGKIEQLEARLRLLEQEDFVLNP